MADDGRIKATGSKGRKFTVTSVTAAFAESVDTLVEEAAGDVIALQNLQNSTEKGSDLDPDLLLAALIGIAERQHQILQLYGKDVKAKKAK